MPKEQPIVEVLDWRKDATGDTSFWRVVAVSLPVVGNKGDFYLCAGLFIACTVGILVAHNAGLLAHGRDIAAMLGQWATLGVNIAVAILGFLIAGFSIFATMTKPELFHLLAKFKANGRPISEFKFVFYNFLHVFAHYLLYLAIGVFAAVMSQRGSPLWYFANLLRDHFGSWLDVAVAIGAAGLVCYTVFALLLLKSFLWNLYQAMVFAIFFEVPKSDPPKPGEPGQI